MVRILTGHSLCQALNIGFHCQDTIYGGQDVSQLMRANAAVGNRYFWGYSKESMVRISRTRFRSPGRYLFETAQGGESPVARQKQYAPSII